MTDSWLCLLFSQIKQKKIFLSCFLFYRGIYLFSTSFITQNNQNEQNKDTDTDADINDFIAILEFTSRNFSWCCHSYAHFFIMRTC